MMDGGVYGSSQVRASPDQISYWLSAEAGNGVLAPGGTSAE